MINWHDKKVLIMGFSMSGKSAAKYLAHHGADVFITENREQKEEDLKDIQELEDLGIKIEFGGNSDEFLNDSYMAIVSPSVPKESELYKKVQEKNIQIIWFWLWTEMKRE